MSFCPCLSRLEANAKVSLDLVVVVKNKAEY
jgi:hypothetical protein